MSPPDFSKEKLLDYLENLHSKYKAISNQLSKPEILNDHKNVKELTKELSRLKPLEDRYLAFKNILKQKKDTETLLKMSDEEEMKELAREEIKNLTEKLKNSEKEIC